MLAISFKLVMTGIFINIKIFKITIFFKLSSSVVGDVSHDPEQVIQNFLSHILTEAKTSFLCRGLGFALQKLWNIQIIWFHLNYFTETLKLSTEINFRIKP